MVARDVSIENNLLNNQWLKLILLTVCSDREADGRLDFAALPFGESNLTAEQTSAFRAVAHWLKSLEGYENLKKRL
jgi:hypothetical protein